MSTSQMLLRAQAPGSTSTPWTIKLLALAVGCAAALVIFPFDASSQAFVEPQVSAAATARTSQVASQPMVNSVPSLQRTVATADQQTYSVLMAATDGTTSSESYSNSPLVLASLAALAGLAMFLKGVMTKSTPPALAPAFQFSPVAPSEESVAVNMDNIWSMGATASVATPALAADGKKALNVVVVGAGLAGMMTAMNLVDQGHKVTMYEGRPFVGGKVSSWQDKDGNHIEMGLHVFFGCYENLFKVMRKLGIMDSLLRKEHSHVFINKEGRIGELDFRFPIGAPFHGLKAFFTTTQLEFKSILSNAVRLATSPVVKGVINFDAGMRDIRNLDNISFYDWWIQGGGDDESIKRMWDPVAYALGFIDCKDISARCMLTIFNFFATKTDASLLRMLEGSPNEFLHKPIVKYLEERGVEFHLGQRVRDITWEERDGKTLVTGFKVGNDEAPVTADAYVFACDVPGIQKVLPQEWRSKYALFDNIYKLTAVPVATVQLRYDGWVTELNDTTKVKNLSKAFGIDNLLYSADADFSCFADLALTSPTDYYKPGEGSLMQLVLTPADPYMNMSDDDIAKKVDEQVKVLFPSARNLNVTWSNVVKLGQSLYREAPGMDPFRPTQETPIPNFFLAGSYTAQDYIDSMEGATISGQLCADVMLKRVDALRALVQPPRVLQTA